MEGEVGPRPSLKADIRLIVYSFIPLKETIKTLSLLSKEERNNLKEPSKELDSRNFIIQLNKTTWPQCMLHEDRMEQFMKSICDVLSYSSNITIHYFFDKDNFKCAEHGLDRQMAIFLALLPDRFN